MFGWDRDVDALVLTAACIAHKSYKYETSEFMIAASDSVMSLRSCMSWALRW